MGKTWVLVVLVSAFMAMLAPTMSQASNSSSLRKLNSVKRYIQSSGNGAGCRRYTRGRYLRQGRSYSRMTKLYAGNEYIIIAAGDSRVRDLDIYLYNGRGRRVARDILTDSKPIVRYSPRQTGYYRVKVKMYSGHGHSNFMVCYID